ncbi:hypothetical protein N0V85_008784, partial [Neurospora sp. IMI 360204]
MLTRTQSRRKEQQGSEAWEILEASTILMSMRFAVNDKEPAPVDKYPSPNITVSEPATPQARSRLLIARRRDQLRVKLAASLSA